MRQCDKSHYESVMPMEKTEASISISSNFEKSRAMLELERKVRILQSQLNDKSDEIVEKNEQIALLGKFIRESRSSFESEAKKEVEKIALQLATVKKSFFADVERETRQRTQKNAEEIARLIDEKNLLWDLMSEINLSLGGKNDSDKFKMALETLSLARKAKISEQTNLEPHGIGTSRRTL